MTLRPLTLLATLVLAPIAACAEPVGPAADEGGGGGDSADDLVGRTIVVHPSSPERRIEYGTHIVRPTIKETGKVLDVFTDDIIAPGPDTGVLEIKVENAVDGLAADAFALQVAIRREGTDTWQPISTKQASVAWQWSSLLAFQVEGVWRVSGIASKYEDTLVGTNATLDFVTLPDQTINLGGDAEFRIHVIPAWNFWDWDEAGYEATLTVGLVKE